jgi:hypothetical protein
MINSDTQKFLGTWKLIFIETKDENGELVRRGKRMGYLIYSADGYMSATFMKEGRPLFASGDIRGGTFDEKIAAFDGYISYCGTFEIVEKMVIHHIGVSLFPNWIGTSQERLYNFEGDRLTLSTPLMTVGGRKLSTQVIWEKVS